VVGTDVAADALVKAARGADRALIVAAGVFDLHQGPPLAEGTKSVGITVTLQPTDKTLTDQDIEAVCQAVVAMVAKATGATLRG
jgi:phenylalanyl-tRNA synthetase beta chain